MGSHLNINLSLLGSRSPSTSLSEKGPEEHYKMALDCHRQGHFEAAKTGYLEAIRIARQIYEGNNNRDQAACLILAKSHFGYASLLKEHTHTFEAEKNYQEAEYYIKRANHLDPNQEEIGSQAHTIFMEPAAFLDTQGEHEAGKREREEASEFTPVAKKRREEASPFIHQIQPHSSASHPKFEAHPSQRIPVSDTSIQEKIGQVERLFNELLSTLESLKMPHTPSLFVVYAHHNQHGEAKADVAKYLIENLSRICINVYSDQKPRGSMPSSASQDQKCDGTLEDILTSQLRLLPKRLRDEVEVVDRVVVCCSGVLSKYLEQWGPNGQYYEIYRNKLTKAYELACEQKNDKEIRDVVKQFSQEEPYRVGFHHVLTEIAFLQIRAEKLVGQSHGIIPVSLTAKSYESCLQKFIDTTVVRVEDIARIQAQSGPEVYPNESRHYVMFKLIGRILVNSEEAQSAIAPFWKEYQSFTGRLKLQPSAPDGTVFFDCVKKTLANVQVAMGKQALLPRNLPLVDLRNALFKHYELDLKIQRISGKELDLASCYINLAIVESKEQQKADKAKIKTQASTFYRPSSYEEIKQANLQRPIPLEKLFEQHKLRNGQVGIPKRVLLQGRAGIGKTTLCKKIVHLCQKGPWKDRFDAVLWLPLRQLKTYNANNLRDLLANKYFSGLSEGEKYAKQLIDHNDKILFILDGLDEVSIELNTGRGSPLGNLLTDLLGQPQLIVTSRPTGVDSSRLKAFDLELETIGFSHENVQMYLEKTEPEFATEILEVMKRTPAMRELGNIPVQLDALCYSWPAVKAAVRKGATVTMTMLYQAMVDKLWRKDAERLNKAYDGQPLCSSDLIAASPKEIEGLLADESDYLSYLSFRGLQKNVIEFDPSFLGAIKKEINEKREQQGKKLLPLPLPFQRYLKQTSFLHTSDVDLLEDERKYYFPHLTFQEFFAAKFLAKHLDAYLTAEGEYKAQIGSVENGLALTPEALKNFVNQHKYDPRYQIVWWMVAGLLKGESLEGFFHFLVNEPRDLLGGAHFPLVTHCLHEARARLSAETINSLEEELKKDLQLGVELKIIYDNMKIGRAESLSAFPEHLLLEFIKEYRRKYEAWILICEALQSRPTLSDKALEILIEASLSGAFFSHAATKVLIPHADSSKLIQKALIERLKRREDEKVEEVAADLGSYEASSELIRDALINLLEKGEFLAPILDVVAVLPPYENSSESILGAFIGMLSETEDSEVKREAAAALTSHVVSAERIRAAFMKMLEEDEIPWLRRGAVTVLGSYAVSFERVRDALIKMLEEDRLAAVARIGSRAAKFGWVKGGLFIKALEEEEAKVRRAVAQALAPHAASFERVGGAFIKALEEDKDASVRRVVAQALAPHAASSELIQNALIKMLEENKDAEVRRDAARALGPHTTNSERIRGALIKALEEDKDAEVRRDAVRALGPHTTNSELIRDALIQTLEEDKDASVRAAAAEALGPYAASTELIRKALVKTLEEDKDAKVRRAVARALGPHAVSSERVRGALIKTVEQDKDANVRGDAAEALGPHATSSEQIRNALIKTLKENEDTSVRGAAARALGPLMASSELIREVFIEMLEKGGDSKASQATTELIWYSSNPQDVLDAILKKEELEDEPFDYHGLANRPDHGYLILPYLSSEQLQEFYTHCLLLDSYDDNMPLYYHDEALHFYTSTGPGKPISTSYEQFEKIKQAFEQARENLLTEFPPKEVALEQKHLIDEETKSENTLPPIRDPFSTDQEMSSQDELPSFKELFSIEE